MAAGKEIKRLRGNISAQTVADLIGISADKLRKWEQRDADPKDVSDIRQVEWYFGCKLEDLKNLDNYNFVQKEKEVETTKQEPQEDFQAKYMTLLEEHLEMKKAFFSELEGFKQMMLDFTRSHDYLKSQFTEVVKALKQVEQNQLAMYAFQGAYYDYWLSVVENNEQVRQIIGEKAREDYERLQQEGIQVL